MKEYRVKVHIFIKMDGLMIVWLVIVHAFVVVCLLLSKLTFSNNSFMNTIRVSNVFDPDKDRRERQS